MHSLSAAVGSSVFGRFGRRNAPDLPSPYQQEIAAHQGDSTSDIIQLHSSTHQQPTAQPPILTNGSRPATSAAHKRESSILSLAASVSDLGRDVKRSVSLRSHRTQPSSSSLGHVPRFSPSSTSNINLPLAEDDEAPASSTARRSISPARRKHSISTRSLSSKFKSAETLPTLSPPDRGFGSSPGDRPTTAIDVSKHPVPMLPTPQIPRRVPPERPPMQPQQSFTSHMSSSSHTNSAPLHQTTSPPASQAGGGGGGYNPRAVYQQIHQTANKRMATIDYLRKVHEGKIYYFSTLNYSPAQLAALPSLQPVKMIRRANNYMILGYSLPTVLDMNSGSPLEYLKALHALLQEFETYQSLSGFDSSGASLSRGRVGAMFSSMGLGSRAGKGRRASTATDMAMLHGNTSSGNVNGSAAADSNSNNHLNLPRSATDASSPMMMMEASPITTSPTPTHDFNLLMTPHLPFDPDFHTTLATLCDALVDAYARLLDLLSSPSSSSSSSSPDPCAAAAAPGVSEAFNKADKLVRKLLVANVAREFDDSSRQVVKGEVAGLGRLVLGGLV